jgi:hypothetical protein
MRGSPIDFLRSLFTVCSLLNDDRLEIIIKALNIEEDLSPEDINFSEIQKYVEDEKNRNGIERSHGNGFTGIIKQNREITGLLACKSTGELRDYFIKEALEIQILWILLIAILNA